MHRTLALLALLPLQAAPQDLPDPLRKRITLERTGTLEELLDHLRAATGANVHLDPRTFQHLDRFEPRDLLLRDVQAASALRWIASIFGLDWAVRDNVVTLAPRAALLPRPVLRSYDIRRISYPPRDRIGPKVAIGHAAALGFMVFEDEPRESSIVEEQVPDLVKMNVAPGTWEGEATAELTPDGRLLVHHSPDVQREVAWLLETLASFPVPTVSFSAEILDADDAFADLLKPGTPSLFAPADIEPVARRVAAARPLRLELAARSLQRAHALLTQEASGVSASVKGSPVVGKWIAEAGVLDARPAVSADGRSIQVELRLSLGQSRELAPTPRGSLVRHERVLTRLETTLLIPNGGGVLLALPARNSEASRPQLCLLRASAPLASPRPPGLLLSADPDPSDLLERLAQRPPADIDLQDAPVDRFAKWLRTASGLNVLVHPDARDVPVTVRLKGVPPARVLDLALEPLGLGLLARDEALFLVPRSLLALRNRVGFIDARDLLYGLNDFPHPGEVAVRSQFTGEDLANLLRNLVHKDRWEEADGHSVAFHDGILILRNAEDVLRDAARFVEDRRAEARRTVAFRADTLTLPAEAADAVLGPGGALLIDAAQYDRLLQRAVHERLGWQGFEGQRTTMSWDRTQDFLNDYSADDDPILGIQPTRSYLEVRPTIEKDGRGVSLEVQYVDDRILEVKENAVRPRAVIQTPVTHAATVRTTVSIPADRMAVLTWGLPAREGQPRQARVIVLHASAR